MQYTNAISDHEFISKIWKVRALWLKAFFFRANMVKLSANGFISTYGPFIPLSITRL